MNETIFHRPVPDAPCFCVGHDGHDPECACASLPEGGDQTTTKSPESVAGAQIGVVPKAIIDAIDNLADCAESDGMFKMDPDGDGSCPESTAPAKAALLRLLSENANSSYGVESSTCCTILQNRPQIIPKIIPLELLRPKPYAYEFGRSNGDGTYSVIIDRGDLVQVAPNQYEYAEPKDAVKDHPIKRLYAFAPPSVFSWIWSDDELPPVDVPVLRIDPDNVDNLGQAEIVTRAGGIENNKGWVEHPAWWMRIPPVSRASS